MGEYRPIETPERITQGIRSIQLFARMYNKGGRTASRVPIACSLLLPYLSDINPLGICNIAAKALEIEKMYPNSVIEAPSDRMYTGQTGVMRLRAIELSKEITNSSRMFLP